MTRLQKLREELHQQIIEELKKGLLTYEQISRLLDCTTATVYAVAQRNHLRRRDVRPRQMTQRPDALIKDK